LPPAGLYSDTNLSGTTQDIMANPKSYFKASLEALDHEIGRLFDALQASNQWENTDVIFIGDNGNSINTAQIADKNRAKGTIYQYGVHVPFIISGPSVVQPGRVSPALVNTADLFATVLELFGYTDWSTQVPANKPVDSKSILPILKNESNTVRPWTFTEIFKTTPDSDDGKTIRNTIFKLLHFDDGHEEFYNLENDPEELKNLLNGTLTALEHDNYVYLCGEMSNLLSNSAFCTASVATGEPIVNQNGFTVYPNPFENQIQLTPAQGNTRVKLFNTLGQTIYVGQNIENQDFSGLARGIYLLYTEGKSQILLKQ
jgi:hypothetical protein